VKRLVGKNTEYMIFVLGGEKRPKEKLSTSHPVLSEKRPSIGRGGNVLKKRRETRGSKPKKKQLRV